MRAKRSASSYAREPNAVKTAATRRAAVESGRAQFGTGDYGRRSDVHVGKMLAAKSHCRGLFDGKKNFALQAAVWSITLHSTAEPDCAPNVSVAVDSHAVGQPFLGRNLGKYPAIAQVPRFTVVVEVVDFPREGVGEIHAAKVGRKAHPVRNAQPVRHFSDAAVRIKAQEFAISAHGARENPALRIGDNIVEPIVARAKAACHLAEDAAARKNRNAAILKQKEGAVALQSKATRDSCLSGDGTVLGCRMIGVDCSQCDVQKE